MSSEKRPGDVKNDFVRWLLTAISNQVSKSNKSILRPKKNQKEYALNEFGNICPYTGNRLGPDEKIELDHIIPSNVEYCGLHLCGNLVATSRDTNNDKKSQNYQDYIKSHSRNTQDSTCRINNIQAYMKKNGYDEALFKSLRIKEFVKKEHDKLTSCLNEIERDLKEKLNTIDEQLKQLQPNSKSQVPPPKSKKQI